MQRSSILSFVLAGLLLSLASASAQEITKLSELVSGMPKAEKQQVRVFTATLEPGDRLFITPTVSQLPCTYWRGLLRLS